MFNINGMSPVVIQEKVKFEPRLSIIIGHTGWLTSDDSDREITIQRNIFNDTFNMTTPNYKVNGSNGYLNNIKGAPMLFTTNVNNVNNIIGDLKLMSGEGTKNHTFFLHSSMFEDAKLRESKSITVVEKANSQYSPTYIFNMYPRFEEINSNVRLREGEYLDIQTLNSVSFTLDHRKIKNYKHPLRVGNGISIERSYSHTYLVPRKISQIDHNDVLYDAYVSNDIGSNGSGVYQEEKVEYDHSLRSGKITSSALAKQMDLTPIEFNRAPNEWEGNESGLQTKPKYIGSFKLFGHTGYDYEKQKGTMGISANSEEGELIPYNYKGSYSRVTTLGVNEIYKKINIIQSQLNMKPILQADSGRYMLDVYDNKDKVNSGVEWKTINQKFFNRDADYIYSLEGLDRLVDLTERLKYEKTI